MLTTAFWKGLAERAIKTAAQVFVATIGVGVGGNSLGVTDVDWGTVLSVTALATILSVATSIGNASFTAGEPEPHGIDSEYGPMTEDQELVDETPAEDLIPGPEHDMAGLVESDVGPSTEELGDGATAPERAMS